MDYHDEEVTCISLFSGYGGLDLGVRRVIPNLRVIAYVEIEAYAIELLAQKISRGEMDEAPIFTDVTQFPAHLFRDKVHLVIAGYPCQDFSHAGNRKGLEGHRGKMWGHTRSVVNGCNARAFFGENVDGHVSLGFDTVVSDLAEDGFLVKGGIYSAFEVGAPHLRKRVFSLSFRTDPRLYPWAKANTSNRGWIDLDELKFRALTTGMLGDSEYDGSFTEQELRSHEGDGDEWAEEESEETEQLEGANRPRDGEGLQGCEPRGYSTIEGCIRQTMGYPIDNGHPAATKPRETEGGEKEGRVQKPTGGSGGAGSLAYNESERRRCGQDESGSDARRIQDEEAEIGGSVRSETGGSRGGDGELADAHDSGSGQNRESTELRTEGIEQSSIDSGRSEEGEIGEGRQARKLANTDSERFAGDGEPEELGEEEGAEGEGGHKPSQAPPYSCAEEYLLTLAKLYDDGFPSTAFEDGEPRIVFDDRFPIRWPARPGRRQYEWEQPRTVMGDTTSEGLEGTAGQSIQGGVAGPARADGKAESVMGGESHAVTRGLHSNRIERLRLLGNGVVWLTASKAFSELLREHIQEFELNDKLKDIS